MRFFCLALFVLFIGGCSDSSSNKERTNFEIAETYINSMEPLKAIPYLEKIKPDDRDYNKAQELITTVNRLYSKEELLKNSNPQLAATQQEWIPAEYLYYGVGVYFGKGEDKKFIGNVLAGYTLNGTKYVVLLSGNHKEIKSKQFITDNEHCFIKREDPNYQRRLLKYK